MSDMGTVYDIMAPFSPIAKWGRDQEKKKEEKKEASAAQEAEARKKAEATALAEQTATDEKNRKRAALSAASTSGFGANTNVARSFLTSL
jgi:hypothetical protein